MIYTLTGASGSGKTTIAKALFDKDHTIVSYTTRPKRPNEIDGYDYYFVSEETFNQLPDLIEHVSFAGHQYGITQTEIKHKTQNGNCVWILNSDGLKNNYQHPTIWYHIIPVFITASLTTLTERLETRDHNDKRVQQLGNELRAINNIQTFLLRHGKSYYQIRNEYLTPQQLITTMQSIIDKTN